MSSSISVLDVCRSTITCASNGAGAGAEAGLETGARDVDVHEPATPDTSTNIPIHAFVIRVSSTATTECARASAEFQESVPSRRAVLLRRVGRWVTFRLPCGEGPST